MPARCGIWTITLWTAGRVPSLVTLSRPRIGASLLGTLTLDLWGTLNTRFPPLTLDEFALLPDRFRALLHTEADKPLIRAVQWFKAAVDREARRRGLSQRGVIWETGFERFAVDSIEELASWRRRIRTGRALGLSGRLPIGEGHVHSQTVPCDGHTREDRARLGEQLGSLSTVASADVRQDQPQHAGVPREFRRFTRRRVASLDRPVALLTAKGGLVDQ